MKPPPAAQDFAELAKVIAELRKEIEALKAHTPLQGEQGPAGEDGKGADCAAVTTRLDALAQRVEALETMLTPDADGRLTGLPPFTVVYRDDATTGKTQTIKVYLGGGYETAPPYKAPLLRGGGK